ncbi:hypothetical protein FB471_5658 [Amycolatopsis cihanbeyliensis]|uniref:Uncharacterized protein n=1 Tax=Amycolatopsis cihanbeyliensis TaxID=1128664 RepID=A0A542DRU5_AMYCI|nr:hypothetical protein FB471_5658 [Amycolatopsis cihanbeyliensis]
MWQKGKVHCLPMFPNRTATDASFFAPGRVSFGVATTAFRVNLMVALHVQKFCVVDRVPVLWVEMSATERRYGTRARAGSPSEAK